MMAMTGAFEVVLAVLAVIVGVAASALFAGLETGLYVLNKLRLELRGSQGDRKARRLQRALARPKELLTALLIATNAANDLVASLAVALFALAGSRRPELLSVVVVTPTLFVLGELLPKNLFRVASETVTYRLSAWVTWTVRVCRYLGLSPAVGAVSHVGSWLWRRGVSQASDPLGSARRIDRFLAEGRAHGVLTPHQTDIARGVMSMQSTRLGEVMVGLDRVVSLPADCSRERFDRTLAGNNFSRLPVWRESGDDIGGIVNVYDVLYDADEAAAPATHVREGIRLDVGANVAEALITLQRAHRAMGLVVGADGRTVGIVTIKDLVEEIVGELVAW